MWTLRLEEEGLGGVQKDLSTLPFHKHEPRSTWWPAKVCSAQAFTIVGTRELEPGDPELRSAKTKSNGT